MTILLVEDNPDHAELIRRSFQEHGARASLTTVPDGEEAIGYLFRRGEWSAPEKSPRPNLILLDLRLPKLDGFHVLEEVKGSPELTDITVVVLTTSQADADMDQAYSSHANSYLVKPVEFDRFLDLVADVDRYWLGWNRQPARAT
jgi:CheY-like chemotaxis protein